MQGIEIPIGAPLGQLDRDLKGATNQISNFATTSLGKLSIINNVKFTFGKNFVREADILASKGKSLGDNLAGPLVKGSNQAGFALTNLSRVAQDAPFGFIGIQNNLNPLLESFQQLKAQTGSASSAFKALGQSLIGPAGLGLALSVISAGILLYQQYQQKANKETKIAADANKELADSIKSLEQVQADGRSNASKDLSKLQSLYNATQNANIPTKERLKIANDLIDRYPKYLEGFSAEEILAGKAAASYNKLTNAILAKGYAQAAEENRQKLINQQLKAKVDLTKEQAKLDKSSAELSKRTAQKQATLDIQGQAALEKGISRTSSAVDDSKNKIKELNDVYKNASSEIKILDNVTQNLINTFGGEVVIDTEKIKKSNENLKTQSDILKQLDIDFKQISADFSITFGKGNEERVAALKKAINELISIGFTKDSGIVKQLQTQLLAIAPSEIQEKGKQLGVNAGIGISEGLASSGPVISKSLNEPLKLSLTDWQLYVNDTLLPQIEGNFKTFFDNVLMNGKLSFDSLGKALLNTLLSIIASDAAKQVTNLFKTTKGSDFTDQKGKTGSLLGGVLSLFGKKAIGTAATTTAATGGTTALATGTAASGGALLPILAGVAAVAGIASLFKKKPKTQAPLPQASSTISTSAAGSSQNFGGGSVVFEISGTNLIGVLNRAGAKLQRFGG
jgi:hypothetical protein